MLNFKQDDMKKIICNKDIKEEIKNNSLFVSAHLLRESIYILIKKDYPDFNRDCYIAEDEVKKYRNKQLESLINKEDNDEYDNIDKSVITSILDKKLISDNIEDDLDEDLTIGQKIADKVAKFGGSWAFIISFAVFLCQPLLPYKPL